MDRAELSSAIIAEMQAVVADALDDVVPELMTADLDLATLERRVQHVGRVILGQLIERVVRAHAHLLLPRSVRCAACGGALKRRERTRHLVGLVGDDALQRAYYWCPACGQSQAPLDAAVGLGAGTVSPGLTRVVARATVDAPFTAAVEHVQEALGATLSAETARRLAERIGTVAEVQTQAAIARVQQGYPAWAEDAIQSAEGTTTLAVDVDGVLVQQTAGWQEMKVGTVAPLGPELHTDRESRRTHLAWGTASYGVGTEEAEAFWWRVHVEARRRGVGTPAVRRVVVLADGARWIWERARAFLGLPGVEVVEIVDIYHAYGYLWAVGHALFGAGTPGAAAWVAPLKDGLYRQGAVPVCAALAALRPPTEEAAQAITEAQTYFTRSAARLDYPHFVARHLPIGSGAAESACTCLVEARLKQAGMRWGVPGSQAMASLRAVQRSGRWVDFWQTHPDRQPAVDARRPASRVTVSTPAAHPAVPPSPPVPRPQPAPARAASQTHARSASAHSAPLRVGNFSEVHPVHKVHPAVARRASAA